MKNKRIKKEERGITLIELTITIAVLLILASVTTQLGLGKTMELKRYNAFLSNCGVDEGMIPLSDDVSISNNFKGVGNSAFYGCISLKNVKISDGVKNIGDGAFYYCNGLKNINIPDSIENIGEFAFYNCYSLKAIKIPSSVKYINNTAFAGCSSLNHIEFNGNVYDSVGNFMAAFNACRASQK